MSSQIYVSLGDVSSPWIFTRQENHKIISILAAYFLTADFSNGITTDGSHLLKNRSDLSCHLIISNPSSPAILQGILSPLKKKELYSWTVISYVIISSCTGKNWKRNSSGINHKNERSLFESADSTHQSSMCHRDSLLVHCLYPSHSSSISFTQLAVTAG